MEKSVLNIFLFMTLFGLFYDNKRANANTILEQRNFTSTTNESRPVLTPKDGNIVCFQCTSWESAVCGRDLYPSLAPYYGISTVHCDDGCSKIVVNHNGKTDVIRGCSKDTGAEKFTCEDDYCNSGTSLKAVLKTIFTSFVCSVFFLL